MTAAAAAVLAGLAAGSDASANTPASWVAPVSGNWTDATKWSTNPNYPSTSGYDALLSVNGSSYTVTFSTSSAVGNVSLTSSDATLTQTGGTLTLAGTLTDAAGEYILMGGTVSGGTLQSSIGNVYLGSPSSYYAPTVNAVTLGGNVTAEGYLNVSNGLTLNNGVLLLNGNGSQVLLAGSQTIGGTGQVVFFASNSGSTLAPADDASTMTIGPGVTVLPAANTVINGVVGRTTAPLVNDGVIACNSANAFLTFTGANWVNAGAINVSAGTLTLGGTTTTANLGTINHTGGTLALDGTLDNRGATLDLARTGPLLLTTGGYPTSTGTIRGGTILSTSPTATLSTNGGTAVLDRVTLGTDLNATSASGGTANLSVLDGLTLQNNHTILLTSGSGITAADASTFGGTGQIVVNNLANGSNYTSNVGGTNVTIGPGVTVRTGTGSSTGNYVKVTTVLNQGTIAVGAQATPTTVTDTVPWVNAGTLSVAAQSLTVGGSWTNTGSMVATGGTLNLTGAWSNPGTITATNAVVNLGGTETGLGTIAVTNGGVVVAGSYTAAQARAVARTNAYLGVGSGGTLDATGDSVNTDPAAPLQLLGGTVRGGTITATNGGQVTGGTVGSTLDTVTLNAPLVGTYLTANNLVNNGSINLSNGGLSLGGTSANNGAITTYNTSVSFNTVPSPVGTFSITGGYEYLYVPATTAQLQQIRVAHGQFSLNNGAVLNNAGTTLVLSAAGAGWAFYGGEVDGGTIASPDGTQLTIASSSGYQFTSLVLDGVTLAANAQVLGFVTPTIKDGLTLANNAVVQFGATPYGPGNMAFAGTQTLGGTGTFLLTGDRAQAQSVYASSGTLTVGPQVSIVNGPNPVTLGMTGGGAIVDYGLVSAPTPYAMTIAGGFTNNGTVDVRNGAIVTFTAPSLLTNLQAGTLVGGTWNVSAGSTLNLGSARLSTNAATVSLSGAGSAFPVLNALANNRGSLTVAAGRTFATSAAMLTNDGLLAVLAGGEVDAAAFAERSDGTLAFGLSTGAVTGGRLVSAGPVSLDGTLMLSLAAGYTPAAGDDLTLLTGTSVSGTFAAVVPPPLSAGLGYSIVYTPTDVEVRFASVPEPAASAALSAIGVSIGRRRRRSIAAACPS